MEGPVPPLEVGPAGVADSARLRRLVEAPELAVGLGGPGLENQGSTQRRRLGELEAQAEELVRLSAQRLSELGQRQAAKDYLESNWNASVRYAPEAASCTRR